MIGIGYLTLAATCKEVGLVLALLLIMITGCGSLYSAFLITRAYRIYNTENYPDLVYKILGKMHYYIIIVNLNLYILFSTTIFVYFGNMLIFEVLKKYGVDFDEYEFVQVIVKILVFLPSYFMSFYEITSLKWIGYLGNFFSFYTAILLIWQTPAYYNSGRFHEISYFKFNFGVFATMGTCFFAFTNHFSITSIVKVMKAESDHSNYSAIMRSLYFPLFLYTTACFTGYVSFGDDTKDLVILRKPLDHSKDIMMTVGQLGIAFANIVSICVRIQSNRDTFFSYFTSLESKDKIKKNDVQEIDEIF